jgi:hypothetical protein
MTKNLAVVPLALLREELRVHAAVVAQHLAELVLFIVDAAAALVFDSIPVDCTWSTLK